MVATTAASTHTKRRSRHKPPPGGQQLLRHAVHMAQDDRCRPPMTIVQSVRPTRVTTSSDRPPTAIASPQVCKRSIHVPAIPADHTERHQRAQWPMVHCLRKREPAAQQNGSMREVGAPITGRA